MSKVCTGCKGLPQPLINFHKSRVSKDGHRARCKVCIQKEQVAHDNANREKVNAQSREWCRNHPDNMRKVHLKRKYGLTPEQYNSMLKDQSGACAICRSESTGRKKMKFFAVDHSHTSGKIRGLLCDPCNKGLSYFKENTFSLENAVRYLKLHKV